MKKLLITAIIILLIILTGITMVKGINVGKLSVLGIKDIKKEDEQLNTTIQQATKLASTDYQKKINDNCSFIFFDIKYIDLFFII